MGAASLILTALRFLPEAVNAGLAVRDLARGISTTDIGRVPTATEQYALNVISQVPTLIDAGEDVYAVLTHANAKVREMVAQNRVPTPDEWDEVNSQIRAKLQAIKK